MLQRVCDFKIQLLNVLVHLKCQMPHPLSSACRKFFAVGVWILCGAALLCCLAVNLDTGHNKFMVHARMISFELKNECIILGVFSHRKMATRHTTTLSMISSWNACFLKLLEVVVAPSSKCCGVKEEGW